MALLWNILTHAGQMLLAASVYVVFGLLVSGLLRAFLRPQAVARHFGTGRFASVFKAALLGIPIPLCSCGVLPAAVSMKKQGANNGATTAFLVATPESGIDSIAVSWALLDPLMTVARPVAAFVTAVAAGIAENFFGDWKGQGTASAPAKACRPADDCQGEKAGPSKESGSDQGFQEKIAAGLKYAFTDVWPDMAGWFFAGLLLAGAVTALVPEAFLVRHLGAGLPSMVLMLAFGIPLYICATASTPVAAALILKGVSPGAALVFLLAGPATNIASMTVLAGVLGKRATAIYLAAIALCSVSLGWLLDFIYAGLGLSARALVGQGEGVLPVWAQWAGVGILLWVTVAPVVRSAVAKWPLRFRPQTEEQGGVSGGSGDACCDNMG